MGSLSVTGFARALAPMLLIAPVAACSGPTNTEAAIPKRYVETPQVSPAAKNRYGEQAEAAYQELAMFSLDQWLVPSVLDPQTSAPSAQQLSDGVVQRLAGTTITRWNERVQAAATGDQQAAEDVSLLRLDSLDAPTLMLPSNGDPVVSQAITGGEVSLGQSATGGVVPLVVTFDQDADLSMRSGRRPYDISLHKTVEFTLLPVEADTAPTAAATGTASPTALPRVSRAPGVTWLISTYAGDISSEYDGAAATAEPTGDPEEN